LWTHSIYTKGLQIPHWKNKIFFQHLYSKLWKKVNNQQKKNIKRGVSGHEKNTFEKKEGVNRVLPGYPGHESIWFY
jgi:hypothetical protein